MCGISGFFGTQPELNQDLLETMNSCLLHRGPDGHDTFLDGPVGLAHTRLAIIDKELGAQPMTSADGRFTLVYNGECYNYRELREQLTSAGRTFHTESDTEVVLEGFAYWGTDVFDRMNGMWGLAIWDHQTNTLTLSRDHFGIKPLYFYTHFSAETGGKWLLFASEIKPLLASKMFQAEADDRTVYRYLKFRVHDDGPETFFRGITRLMPGEMLQINSDGMTIAPYTTFKDDLRTLSAQQRPLDDQALRTYQKLLVGSITDRLRSDVPVGTSLSGGLDSTTVALAINRMLDQGHTSSTQAVGARQNTFSAVFPGSLNNEESYVDDALDACAEHVNAHKIYPDADQFKADLIDFVRTQEEPTISTGPYAQFSVMKEASKHVTVLLDGQGADELMAGYIPYYLVWFRQLKAQKRLGLLAKEMAASSDMLARTARFRVKDKVKMRSHLDFGRLLNGDFAAEHRGETFTTVSANVKERLIEDVFHNSLPALLRYEDRNTMRFSLEGRVPFLDTETVRFLFSLSDEAIIKDSWNKNILRRAVTGLVPDSIRLRRNKIGFTTPEDEWFYRIKGSIFDILSSASFGSRPWFNQAEVLQAFDDFINHRNDAGTMTFWRLVNLELWARIFLDSDNFGAELQGSVAEDTSDHGAHLAADPHTPLEANAEKNLDLTLPDGTISRRYPVQTPKFSADNSITTDITRCLVGFFEDLARDGDQDDRAATAGAAWNVTVSEKIIAIMQGRSWFVWDIHPSFAARQLSKLVRRTPAGIGLGSPATMQLAIDEAGLPRILLAAAGSAVGKALGKHGVFYNLAGANVRAIDGPTEYSVFPSNVSAKLPPKDADLVAAELADAIREAVPEQFRDTFQGVVVMDANDIGQNVLGLHASKPAEHYAAQFKDNPLGQGRQHTPMAVVFDRNSAEN